MKVSDLPIVVKKIPNGYTGKWTWAVVEISVYGDEIIESGFSTKKDALAWLEEIKTKKLFQGALDELSKS